MKTYAIAGTALLCLGLNSHATARTLSPQECSEGGDFIRNAALARDNGMDGTTFVTKLLADLVTIRSFPPSIRWFVQDQQDEDLLVKATVAVFENPLDPEAHRRGFLGNCIAMTTLVQ